MAFDHERLDVYQLALEFLLLADEVASQLPKGRAYIADQLSRASLSISLNIAEGAGKYSRADKRRYYLSALGSSTECAAIFDAVQVLKAVPDDLHARGKAMLERIASMLIKLAKSQQDPG